ncbi:hypothetical protein Tco_0522181 [Tanacetum coccineum]
MSVQPHSEDSQCSSSQVKSLEIPKIHLFRLVALSRRISEAHALEMFRNALEDEAGLKLAGRMLQLQASTSMGLGDLPIGAKEEGIDYDDVCTSDVKRMHSWHQLDHPLSGTLEQLDWSLVRKIQVVAVDRLWKHIPISDMVKYEVEIETLGECVDEIDKLAELIGKHEADQHW